MNENEVNRNEANRKLDLAGVDAAAPPRISMLGVILLACLALHMAMLLLAVGEGRLGWTVWWLLVLCLDLYALGARAGE